MYVKEMELLDEVGQLDGMGSDSISVVGEKHFKAGN